MRTRTRPIRSMVLVLDLENKETTDGGIVVVRDGDRRRQQAKVLRCGPDATQLNEGELVLVAASAGIPVDPTNDPRLRLVHQDDVMAAVEEDA